MKILNVEKFDEAKLLSTLQDTRLRGFGAPRVYADATIQLTSLSPCDLAPTQRYVLKSGVRKVLQLREALLPFDVDLFRLHGGVFITTSDSPGEKIPLIPPVIEESLEPDGRKVLLINDGIHRVFAAKLCNERITVALVKDVPVEYPYYAFALPNGWGGVTQLDELPDNFQKKEYRQPDNYKALFREFNSLFPGVQKQRKRSNPVHLRA